MSGVTEPFELEMSLERFTSSWSSYLTFQTNQMLQIYESIISSEDEIFKNVLKIFSSNITFLYLGQIFKY